MQCLGIALSHAAYQPANRMEGTMTWKQTLIAGAGTLLLQLPAQAQAFECPTHFAEAEVTIERAERSIQSMQGGMPMAARSHLDDARMTLAEAKFHHSKEENHHHAKAIVRAGEARGHAIAAYFLSRTAMNQ